MTKTLADLQPGDEVLLTKMSGFGLHKAFVKAAVERVTRTQIIVQGVRFRARDGGEVGALSKYSSWADIRPWSDEYEGKVSRTAERLKRAHLSRSIEQALPECVDNDRLEAALAALRGDGE